MFYNACLKSDSYCIPYEMISCAMAETFHFIKEHQVSPHGEYHETTLFLGEALTKPQDFNHIEPREDAFNTVTGVIKEVKQNSVVLKVSSNCKDHFQYYTVQYLDIFSFQCDALKLCFSDFVKSMYILPPMCTDCNDPYFELLKNLKFKIREQKKNHCPEIYLIYAGVFSRGYMPYEINIVKNLVVIEQTMVIPAIWLGGFFTATHPKHHHNDSIKEGN